MLLEGLFDLIDLIKEIHKLFHDGFIMCYVSEWC